MLRKTIESLIKVLKLKELIILIIEKQIPDFIENTLGWKNVAQTFKTTAITIHEQLHKLKLESKQQKITPVVQTENQEKLKTEKILQEQTTTDSKPEIFGAVKHIIGGMANGIVNHSNGDKKLLKLKTNKSASMQNVNDSEENEIEKIN